MATAADANTSGAGSKPESGPATAATTLHLPPSQQSPDPSPTSRPPPQVNNFMMDAQGGRGWQPQRDVDDGNGSVPAQHPCSPAAVHDPGFVEDPVTPTQGEQAVMQSSRVETGSSTSADGTRVIPAGVNGNGTGVKREAARHRSGSNVSQVREYKDKIPADGKPQDATVGDDEPDTPSADGDAGGDAAGAASILPHSEDDIVYEGWVLADVADGVLLLAGGLCLTLLNTLVSVVPGVPHAVGPGDGDVGVDATATAANTTPTAGGAVHGVAVVAVDTDHLGVDELCEALLLAVLSACALMLVGVWASARQGDRMQATAVTLRSAITVAAATGVSILAVLAYSPIDAAGSVLLVLVATMLAEHAAPASLRDVTAAAPSAPDAPEAPPPPPPVTILIHAVPMWAVVGRLVGSVIAWVVAFTTRDLYTFDAGFFSVRLVAVAHALDVAAWVVRTRREQEVVARVVGVDEALERGAVYSIGKSSVRVSPKAGRATSPQARARSGNDLLENSTVWSPRGRQEALSDAAARRPHYPLSRVDNAQDDDYRPSDTYAELADESNGTTSCVTQPLPRQRTLSRRRQSRIKILGGGYCEVGINTDLSYDAAAAYTPGLPPPPHPARIVKRRFSEASLKSGPVAPRQRYKSADGGRRGESAAGSHFERQNSCESLVSFVSFAASVTRLPGADQPRTFAPADPQAGTDGEGTEVHTPTTQRRKDDDDEDVEIDGDDRSIDLQSGWGQNFRPPPGLPKLSNSGEWGSYRPCSSSRSVNDGTSIARMPSDLHTRDFSASRIDRSAGGGGSQQVTVHTPSHSHNGGGNAPAVNTFPQRAIMPMSIADARREVHELLHEDGRLLQDRTAEQNQTALLESLPQNAIYMIVNLISRLSEETDVLKVNNLIVAGVCEILKCDRASVFLVEGDSVRTFDDNGLVINVPMDKSLVGHAALTCKVLNIPDAYSDPRFNKDVDKETGYTTRNLLVYPITRDHFKGSEREATEQHTGVFAVIEAINKLEGVFSYSDETILALLGKQAGVLLSNSHMYHQLQTEMHKTATLLEVSREISDVQLDLGKVMDKIMAHARKVLLVERASVFLVDEGKKELWSILTDSEMAAMLGGDNVIRLPVGVGIAGTVASTGNIINIEDAYHSSLFNPDFDRLTGFTTKTCLCVPIRVSSKAGRVLGVMQFINKVNGQPFGMEDEALAITFSTFVGISLNNLLLYDELREGQLIRQKNKELVMLRDKAKLAAEAKANFLMSMSHEIRTPMSGVICMTELLETTALTSEQEEMVTTIRNCGESLLGIINDILDYGRLESGKMELEMGIIDLVAFCEHTMDVIRGKVEVKNISMHLLVSPNLPTHVVGDEFRLRQVLINLLGNAVKFTPNHGEIMLSVKVREGMEDEMCASTAAPVVEQLEESTRPKASPVKNNARDTGNAGDEPPETPVQENKLQRVGSCSLADDNVHIEFRVSDTGIGIPPEKHASLFLPFHQASAGTTRTYGGSGLGLSICKQIMEVMSGSISVASTEGKGSCFKIRAPFRRLEKVLSKPKTFNVVEDMLKRNYMVRPRHRVLCASALDIQQQIFKEFFRLFDAKTTVLSQLENLAATLAATPQDVVIIDLFSVCKVQHGSDPTESLTKCLELINSAVRQQTHLCILTTMNLKATVAKTLNSLREDPDRTALLTTPPKHELMAAFLETMSENLKNGGSATNTPRNSQRGEDDAAATAVAKVTKATTKVPLAPSTNTSTKRLLVAEDNETNQLLIKRQLSQFGVEPKICSNGQIAIESLLEQRYDVIFMDCHMPVLDGYGASRKIRDMEREGKLKGERISIVALTADALPETRSYCLEAGMDDYVTKPIRKQVLKQVLDKWYFCTIPMDTEITANKK